MIVDCILSNDKILKISNYEITADPIKKFSSYSYGPPYMAEQKQDDQLEHTYSSYVRIRDVALNTCQM